MKKFHSCELRSFHEWTAESVNHPAIWCAPHSLTQKPPTKRALLSRRVICSSSHAWPLSIVPGQSARLSAKYILVNLPLLYMDANLQSFCRLCALSLKVLMGSIMAPHTYLCWELRAGRRTDGLFAISIWSKMPPVANCDVSCVALSFIQTRRAMRPSRSHITRRSLG
jgi:hypothetical protein